MAETLTVVVFENLENGDRPQSWAYGYEAGYRLVESLARPNFRVLEIVECDLDRLPDDNFYRKFYDRHTKIYL